ncbi:exodeoxyribonuclease V subunit alpha [Avibacterium paragallinarum]|uniref:exodeoxyribonuclease V subunit alpha n=1 Tax=Avibacterium paragallinarum TaxID=728 RepID=UPI0021F6F99A|nr:exodeoxyribonuclease V subunit alpha [Avibacterium paragallinarum]UXN38020.1 exodeoxyribonuclease V subunit alpha [Avibacterium paragallinarum]
MLSLLKELKQKSILSEGDYHFARLIAEKQQGQPYSPLQQNLAILLAALCHYSYQQGHSCLHLEADLLPALLNLPYSERDYLHRINEKIEHLPVEQWQSQLQSHIAFTHQPQDKVAPLVFQFERLYFYRIWQDEYRVAEYFAKSTQSMNVANEATQKMQSAVQNLGVFDRTLENAQIAEVLQKYFPETPQKGVINWQKIAVAMAMKQAFTLISGGPGTGKTTTVTRLLLALQTLYQRRLRIKLVAPTGKATARLKESMDNSLARLKKELALDDELIQAIPTQPETLHRLLGVRFFEENPKHNKQNPLLLDVLVVDESSMIDLSLMAKLLQALQPQTKLILLGDKDQLASVEAGAILAELGKFLAQGYSPDFVAYLAETTGQALASNPAGNPIRDHLCHLTQSHRFDEHSAIGRLAKLINQGKAEESWQFLHKDIAITHFQQVSQQVNDEINCDVVTNSALSLVDLAQYQSEEGNSLVYQQHCAKRVVQSAVRNYTDFLQEIQKLSEQTLPITPEQVQHIFAAFNQVRYLTALRVGELGSEKLNQYIAEGLRAKGLVQFHHPREHYVGKPIMITQNDSNVGLYNGDIGLYLISHDEQGIKRGRFYFENGKRELASRIPSHEPAFAMTVHKSQGSEFNHALMVLPTDPNPILSRELVYTGITRAKTQVTVFSTEQSWKTAVRKQTKRQSGLALLLQRQSE